MLLFVAINTFIQCTKEHIQPAPPKHPLTGRWQSFIPANPHWYYTFNEDGTMCQKLNQWGADSEDCFYRWFTYGAQQDTAVITADGKTRVWVLKFEGDGVVGITNITDGAVLAPKIYLHRANE